MRRLHVTRVLAVAAAAALLAAGCTGGDPKPTATVTATTDPATTSAAPSAPIPSATPTPSTAPPADEQPPPAQAPFPADLAPDTATASANAGLSPVNLRFGVHDGYDRLVLDLEGTGTPGWTSQYVDDPRSEGSGESMDLEGTAYLQTTVKGVIYPTEPGAKEYVGSRRFQPASAGVIQEVVYGDVFEGQAEVYIGVSSKQPFRVFLLEDPTRIVIDIYHP